MPLSSRPQRTPGSGFRSLISCGKAGAVTGAALNAGALAVARTHTANKLKRRLRMASLGFDLLFRSGDGHHARVRVVAHGLNAIVVRRPRRQILVGEGLRRALADDVEEHAARALAFAAIDAV